MDMLAVTGMEAQEGTSTMASRATLPPTVTKTPRQWWTSLEVVVAVGLAVEARERSLSRLQEQ